MRDMVTNQRAPLRGLAERRKNTVEAVDATRWEG